MKPLSYKDAKDWHPADIKAELEKKGYNFARIAREYGYCRKSPGNVLRMPWAPMEEIIGKILRVHPSIIWPSRYDAQGHPLKSKGIVRLPKQESIGNG